MFSEIKDFLAIGDKKYVSPTKAEASAEQMQSYKEKGQKARKEFKELAEKFQVICPHLQMQKVSHWLNQAQVLRPHFWVYFKETGELSEPMFALRLYGDENCFGVSVEVSFIERKKDDHTLQKQNRVLTVPIADPAYYVVQEDGVSQRLMGTEKQRKALQQKIQCGEIRKVLIRRDVPLSDESSLELVLENLQQALLQLTPFYEATRDSRIEI